MLPSGDEGLTYVVFCPLQSADIIPFAGRGQSLGEGTGFAWGGGWSAHRPCAEAVELGNLGTRPVSGSRRDRNTGEGK